MYQQWEGKIVAFQRAGGGTLALPRHDYEFDIPLTEVTSSSIARFDAYWHAKRRAGRLPGRADIDPADLKPILPNIILLNVHDEPFRVSVRLRGTRIDEFRPKGQWQYLHEATTFDRGRREDYVREMELVVRHRRPFFARDWMTSRFGALCDLYAGLWPLSSDGQRVDMLVVIEDFDSLEPEDFYFV